MLKEEMLMIKHLVFFKLKDRSPENIAKAAETLRSMEGKIDILRHIEVGVDFVKSGRSFDIALVTHFDSREDLDAYATHPEHLPILDYMKTVIEQSVAVDYEQ
jgi:antibiotic biosynthesis monooxygenase (ABM) superfamily enzyme